MSRAARLAAALAAALALAGCASVRYCGVGGRNMVVVENTGWYFLNFIPLASGNPERPNRCSCRLFRQTTTLESNMKMLEAEAARRGAVDIVNANSSWTDESVLFILFKRHMCQTSAELIIPTEEDLKCE